MPLGILAGRQIIVRNLNCPVRRRGGDVSAVTLRYAAGVIMKLFEGSPAADTTPTVLGRMLC